MNKRASAAVLCSAVLIGGLLTNSSRLAEAAPTRATQPATATAYAKHGHFIGHMVVVTLKDKSVRHGTLIGITASSLILKYENQTQEGLRLNQVHKVVPASIVCLKGTRLVDQTSRASRVQYCESTSTDGKRTRHGAFAQWYPNGRRLKAGSYRHGAKHGAWITWYASGQVYRIWFMVSGKWHGGFKQWHVNGRIAMTGQYRNGHRFGCWRMQHRDGRLKPKHCYPDFRFLKALKLKMSGTRKRNFGIGLAITGLVLSVVGIGLVAASPKYDRPSDYDDSCEEYCLDFDFNVNGMRVAGIATIVVGALFWVPGAVLWAKGNERRNKADRLLKKYRSNIQPTDPNHERRMATTVRMGQPRTQVFNWRFQF